MSEQKTQTQECFKCKAAGFPQTAIGFEHIGDDPSTGKKIWKLTNPDGSEHKHKSKQGANSAQRDENIKAAQEARKNEVNALLLDSQKTRKEMRNLRKAIIELIARPNDLTHEEVENTLGLETYEEVNLNNEHPGA
jgi:hypothetical protein